MKPMIPKLWFVSRLMRDRIFNVVILVGMRPNKVLAADTWLHFWDGHHKGVDRKHWIVLNIFSSEARLCVL